MKKSLAFFSLILSLLLLYSCENEGDDAGEASGLTSSFNGSGSHNAGKNCLSCHQFTVAGTVYSKDLASVYPGATVKVTSQVNGGGTLLGTLEVDKKGNFYTGKSISFGSGAYVSVTGTTGTIKHMGPAITSGACNSCHGSSTSKVWAD
jgi:hypothetical protein